jgi:hypothetical protein
VCSGVDLEDGQIGAGVGAGERCRHGAPSGRVTVISSSRRMVCSAVTITPGRQNTPLDENRGRA